MLVPSRKPYIDGQWVHGGAAPFSVYSPASEEVVAQVEGASIAQFDEAIEAARTSFDKGPWPQLSTKERISALRKFGVALESRRDQLIETVIQETGCARGITEYAQVDLALKSIQELCNLYEAMPEWEHNEAPLQDYLVGSKTRITIRKYEPLGVVAAITPYNFPFITNVWKVIPALLAGCTVVLRPSPLTPLQALVFGEAAEESGLHAGVLNVVAESGSEGAKRLTEHPMVDCISFTGSTAVGKAIALQASTTLKRTILELGGKSVQLYLPDTFSAGNYDHVVYGAMTVFIANCGQGCALQTRMLVPEAHKAEVVAAVTTLAGSLPVGDPSDSANVIGPLISQEHRERVHRIVTESIKVGAKLTAGGRYPPGLKTGWFYEPTVLDVEDSNTPAVRQEIFGPVITIQGYRDIDHAIELANDGQYGLSGGIYTGDLKKGLSVAEKIRSGTVQINTTWASGYTPMGGIKQSGYGSERGVAGIRAFQYLKHLVIGSA